jgi:hypothetical protein
VQRLLAHFCRQATPVAEAVTFERRVRALEDSGFGEDAGFASSSGRSEWRELFCQVMDEFQSLVLRSGAARGQEREQALREATYEVVHERYAHCDPEVREDLIGDLLELWDHWRTLDIEEARRQAQLASTLAEGGGR